MEMVEWIELVDLLKLRLNNYVDVAKSERTKKGTIETNTSDDGQTLLFCICM